MECSIIHPALSLLMKHLVIGQRQKAPNFWAFHWSTHGCLVSIGQHFVTTRVVHLPKRTETSLITESDLITNSDQAVHAVHGCNSWFINIVIVSQFILPFPIKNVLKERKCIADFESVCIIYETLYLKMLLRNKGRCLQHFQCNLLYK